MAFHPYPHLIPQLFNVGGFGPPRAVTRALAWTWVDHSASGLLHATTSPVKTRFRYGSAPGALNLAAYSNSPAHYAKGTRSPGDAPKGKTRLPQLVGKRFQVLFHSPPGVLFTFPSRYWFAIGRQRVFSLRRWSSQIPTRFLVSRGTWVPDSGSSLSFVYRAFTCYGQPFQF